MIVIGFLRSDYVFQVCYPEQFAPAEDPSHTLTEVAGRCRRYPGPLDWGRRRRTRSRVQPTSSRSAGAYPGLGILYSESNKEPRRDGALLKWTVNRSAVIGCVRSRQEADTCPPAIGRGRAILDQSSCEIAEYDDHKRSIKYTHPETQQDDALHATVYAILTAIYVWSSLTG